MGRCTLLLQQQGHGPPNLMYKYMHMCFQQNHFESDFQCKDLSPVMLYPQPLDGTWIKNSYPIHKWMILHLSYGSFFGTKCVELWEW